MPTASIKTNIKLDGEKEYKAAVGEINTALGTLDSKLKLLKNTYAENKDNVEGLTKINETLNEKILTQKEKISALEDALKNAAQEYGESDARTQKWQQQLNKASSTLIDMERELRDNTDALKDAGVVADNFSGGIEDLAKQVGASADGLGDLAEQTNASVDELERASQAAEDFSDAASDGKKQSDGFGGAVENLAGDLGVKIPPAAQKAITKLGGVGTAAGAAVVTVAALGAAAVAAEKKLADMTKETAANAAELLKQASITGQSAQTIQELTYAGERLGVSYDRIQDSLKETTNKMQEARDGSEDVANAYKRLGIRITNANGELRDAESVFYETIDALSKMENRTERDAVAMDLLSESARELNPLIEAGSGKIKEYAQEAQDMGYILSDKAVAALKDVDTAVKDLDDTRTGVQNKLSSEFAPYLANFLGDTRTMVQDLGETLDESGIVTSFGLLLETFGGLEPAAGRLADVAFPVLSDVIDGVAMSIAALSDGISELFGESGTALEEYYKAYNDAQIEKMLSGNRQNSEWSSGGGFGGFSKSSFQEELDNAYSTAGKRGTISNFYDTATDLRKYSKVSDATAASQYREYLKDNPDFLSFDVWKKRKGYNASGTDYWYGGRTLIGENGPEVAILPQGTRILTAQESRQVSGGDTYNITIPASSIKEFEDIIRIVKNRRRVGRMEGAL